MNLRFYVLGAGLEPDLAKKRCLATKISETKYRASLLALYGLSTWRRPWSGTH